MSEENSQGGHTGFLLMVLADNHEEPHLREEAAMYLGHVDDAMALAALICIASD